MKEKKIKNHSIYPYEFLQLISWRKNCTAIFPGHL